jgi:hypothetical protein
MDFRDTVSADLPTPRDDEPAGLRQDILDELADHLTCSYHRELLRGANPGDARRRAIERFGNPAAVARRLWLDAMKGKIMAQRVLIATCLVMVVACCGIACLVWNQSSRAAAQAAEANLRLAEVLGQTQATNQEMLKQLQAMAKPAPPAKSGDWIPVRFKLTVEKPDGPPAIGYEVVLGRGYGGAKNNGAIHRRSDATGQADFGVVQPGDWEYSIQAGLWNATGGLNAIPGALAGKEIVCPKDPPDRAQVKVRVNWPGRLADKDLVAVTLFKLEDQTYQPPLAWSTYYSVQLLGRPRGGFTALDQDIVLTAKTADGDERPGNYAFNSVHIDRLRRQGRVHSVLPLDSSTPQEEPMEVWAGRYSLDRLMLFRSLPDRADTNPGRSELLTLMSQPGDQGVQVHVQGGTIGMMGPGEVILFLHGHHVKPSSLDQNEHFEARPGQTSEWVVSLPDETVKEVEKRLTPNAPPAKAG